VCGPVVSQVAEERLANMRTVRAFVQEHNESAVYNSHIDNVLRLSYKEAMARGCFWAMVACLSFHALRLVRNRKLMLFTTANNISFQFHASLGTLQVKVHHQFPKFHIWGLM